MSDPRLFKLLDLGINLLMIGFERQALVARVKEMEAAGLTADEITDALHKMADEAIENLRKQLDGTPS